MERTDYRIALAMLATAETILKKDKTLKDTMPHFAELICETAARLVGDGLSENDKETAINETLSEYGLDSYRTDQQ